jgi:hypothetical protein
VVLFGLWKRSCPDVIQDSVASIARYVIVRYEFSYDPTCAASSEVRLVAPLKDRKELKSSNVLVAAYLAWNEIYFEIDQCDSKTQARPVGAR